MEENFKKIIAEHNGIIYKISSSYTEIEEDFKDLYQEILIQLWQSFASFKAKSKLSTWIYKVALNTAITYKKKNKKNLLTSGLDETLYNVAEDLTGLINQEQNQKRTNHLLYGCINKLSKNERAIILLHLENNSYEEIAEIMGIKTNLVGVKIHRSKKKLQTCLKRNGYGRS